jgi:hypothetical protein
LIDGSTGADVVTSAGATEAAGRRRNSRRDAATAVHANGAVTGAPSPPPEINQFSRLLLTPDTASAFTAAVITGAVADAGATWDADGRGADGRITTAAGETITGAALAGVALSVRTERDGATPTGSPAGSATGTSTVTGATALTGESFGAATGSTASGSEDGRLRDGSDASTDGDPASATGGLTSATGGLTSTGRPRVPGTKRPSPPADVVGPDGRSPPPRCGARAPPAALGDPLPALGDPPSGPADEEPEAEEPAEPSVSAKATGIEPMAVPIPNATANAPTRPT